MKNKMSLVVSVLAGTVLLGGCQNLGLVEKNDSNTENSSQKTVTAAATNVEKTKTVNSKYSYEETLQRLEKAIVSKNMTVFAKIDHTKAAQKVDLSMQPATVLIFGNPKAGTPLMKKDPSFALQLPLKVLVTEVDGKVQVVFNTTESLIENTGIDYSDVENTLAGAEKLITKTVTE